MARMRDLIKFDYVINEQSRPRIEIRRGKLHTIGKGKPGKTEIVDFKSYQPKTPQDQWDTYLAGDAQMVSLMLATSKRFWKKLKTDATHKGYAVAALEEFNDTYDEFKWSSVEVSDKKITTREPIKGKSDLVPGVGIKLPGNLEPSSKFFVDNYYQVTDIFIQSVKEDIIDPIIEQLESMAKTSEGKAKAFIDSMDVKTSCSTLPNGKSPDGEVYSFEELSKLRNETATNYVLSELRKIGVFIPDTFKPEQNWMGTNTDKPGTSGPAWDSNWSEKIKAQKRPEYEQYKYLDMDLLVGFTVDKEPIPIPKKDDFLEVKSDIYTVKFIKPAELPYTFQFQWPIFNRVRKKKRKSKHKANTQLICPNFDSDKKHFWNDPKLGYQ
jgi:hypothetical protein